MPPQDDDLLRDAAEDHLVAAEAKVEAAVDTAVDTWLETVRFLIMQAAAEVAPNFTLAVDAWRGAEKVWLDQVDTVIIPAIAEAYRGEPLPVIADGVVKIGDEYGEQFRAAQRADEFGAYRAQGEYMRTVRDRFKIWPEGAFEDVRPELMESASEAESIEQVIDRVGRVLDIDKNSRTIKAEINVIEKRLMDDDLDPAIRKALAKQRRELWKAHDAEVSSWKWKARRIARTETHGSVNAGQLARARASGKGFKRWLANKDVRTRDTHVIADGQIVNIADKFQVGLTSMLDFPGDGEAGAPGSEVINCRCTMQFFDFDEAHELDYDDDYGKITPGKLRMGRDDPYEVREALQRKRLMDGPGDILAEYLALGGDRYLAEWGEVIVDDSERIARVADQLDDENRKFWQSIAERASLDLDEVIAMIAAAARVYKRDSLGRFAATNSGGTTVSVDNGPLATSEHVEERARPERIEDLPRIEDGRDVRDPDEQLDRMDENVAATNPRWKEGDEYQVNCQRCVQALELRDRGYDVEAGPMYEPPWAPREKWSTVVLTDPVDLQMVMNPNPIRYARKSQSITGGLSQDLRFTHINMLWTTKDGRPSKFTRSGTKEKTVADLEKQPRGSRGWVINEWDPASGNSGKHIFSWQVVDDPVTLGTRVRFVDSQKSGRNVSEYLDKSRPTLAWMRVDDLVPAQTVLDMVE